MYDFCYSGDNDLNLVGWWRDNTGTGAYPQPVKGKLPNALGFYDMSGNVFEWCWDWFVEDYAGTCEFDSNGPATGTQRVMRGGHSNSTAPTQRVTYRWSVAPYMPVSSSGFRVTCSSRVRNNCTAAGGVMINGVCWAKRNVDAPGTFTDKEEDFGMFYQWNRDRAWLSTGLDPEDYLGNTDWDFSLPDGTEWEADNDPSPNGFRVPTRAEWDKLTELANVARVYTTRGGVNGWLFTDKCNDNKLFLPLPGLRRADEGDLFVSNNEGYYWSSTQSSPSTAYLLYLMYSMSANSNVSVSKIPGCSIRPVLK